MQKGVVAIVGPMTSTGVKFTQPYCAGFHIPQLAPVATDPTFSFTPANFPYLVRLSPSDTIQCQALAGLITHYNWTQFALLTSKDDYGLWLFLSLSHLNFPRIWFKTRCIVWVSQTCKFYFPAQYISLARLPIRNAVTSRVTAPIPEMTLTLWRQFIIIWPCFLFCFLNFSVKCPLTSDLLAFLGINGLLALKDIANQKGWKITANEHFDPVSDFSTLNVNSQLETIQSTRTRIVVLNTLARYTVVILTQAFRMGMLKDWVWIVADGSTNTVSSCCNLGTGLFMLVSWVSTICNQWNVIIYLCAN